MARRRRIGAGDARLEDEKREKRYRRKGMEGVKGGRKGRKMPAGGRREIQRDTRKKGRETEERKGRIKRKGKEKAELKERK